jgi:hypothetical protein
VTGFELVAPPALDETGLDALLEQVAGLLPGQRSAIIELGSVERITPAGALGLLHLGRRLRRRGLTLLLHLPVAPPTQALLDRIGFFEQARFVFQPYPTHRKPVADTAVPVALPLASILRDTDLTSAVARLGQPDLEPILRAIWNDLAGRSPAFVGAWADAGGAPLRIGLSIDDSDQHAISERARGALESGDFATELSDWLSRRGATARLRYGMERRVWGIQAPVSTAAPLAGLLIEITLAR